MKFNHRTTTIVREPIQIGFDILHLPKTQLIYRGSTYNYIPPRTVISREDRSGWPTVTLIYRGTAYQRKIQPPKPYRKPRAINWRWQFS